MGAPLVRANVEEHAKFLCKASKTLHLIDDNPAAHARFAEAQAIALELSVSANSELGRAIAEVENLFSKADSTDA